MMHIRNFITNVARAGKGYIFVNKKDGGVHEWGKGSQENGNLHHHQQDEK
jgi:hypothetical protein